MFFIFTYNWGADKGCYTLEKIHFTCNGVIDNCKYDDDYIKDDDFDIGDGDTFDGDVGRDVDGDLDGDDNELDGNLEKEEKAKCIGEGISTK